MTFDNYLEMQLRNDEFRKIHERNKPKHKIISKLVHLMSNNKSTLDEISYKTNISPNRIQDIEEGDEPTAYELSCLADAVGYKIVCM